LVEAAAAFTATPVVVVIVVAVIAIALAVVVFVVARTRLISREDATGNSRVTLPFATSLEGREVGARSGRSMLDLAER